ncbi:MAG TPA: heat shock protein HspQ [Acidiferrobacteraceae bacterium]|nr:MAG: heat shock protein HspQ [Gammaproteobacteria bacterium]HDO78218.1 heat shock protein HspQ [Acidiferrobacteraceae bacterium]HEX19215.1 heat shock protein HspQ [Acidiferrobacteraceae bacterium]
MESKVARFAIGQLIHHKLFHYRGVIVDVDSVFQGTEEWYQQVARSRPPKDQPWYRVLVDQDDSETYVAERNLESDSENKPIQHPLVSQLFNSFEDGRYHRSHSVN